MPISSSPFELHFETVVAASPMLGHRLESRSRIREQQDLEMLEAFDERCSIPLASANDKYQFAVCPLDILVCRDSVTNRPTFHVLEMNGTGIGGVSNMPAEPVAAIADSLRQIAKKIATPESVILLPVSGKESKASPRLNKLIHEKLIFAEAIQAGMADATKADVDIVTMAGLISGVQSLEAGRATVVIGYMKEMLDTVTLEDDGKIFLYGRPVVGAVNDRFCLNLMSKFKGEIDLDFFRPINATYLAGGDKGVAYSLMDDLLQKHPHPLFPDQVLHAHAASRESLIENVFRWLRMGRRVVIKPHGTGVGHGIEFFLDPNESRSAVIRRIDESIQTTEEFYGTVGGAFPYTLCEYLESDTVPGETHPLAGHKYELRVVVYRDGMSLKACPTIAKISATKYDAENKDRNSLINNITHSTVSTAQNGTEFMLPLCNQETLDLLGLSRSELEALCSMATRYVNHAIQNIESMSNHLKLFPEYKCHDNRPNRSEYSFRDSNSLPLPIIRRLRPTLTA